MYAARSLFSLILLPCVLLGCRSAPSPGTGEAGTAPEPPATVEPPGPAPTAESFEVGECARFMHKPDNCNGSPENPSCISEFELKANGGGTYLLDDIIADAKWTRADRTIAVEVPDISETFEYTIAENETDLLSKSGSRYERRSCD